MSSKVSSRDAPRLIFRVIASRSWICVRPEALLPTVSSEEFLTLTRIPKQEAYRGKSFQKCGFFGAYWVIRHWNAENSAAPPSRVPGPQRSTARDKVATIAEKSAHSTLNPWRPGLPRPWHNGCSTWTMIKGPELMEPRPRKERHEEKTTRLFRKISPRSLSTTTTSLAPSP